MTTRTLDLCSVVETAASENGIPGAAVSLCAEGEVQSVHFGVRSLESGESIDAETRFHIGSSAKMLTAALVGVAIDQEKLELHRPIASLLPSLRLDPSITVFHLLTHTAGFDGDLFFDTGEDEDAIAAYVDRLAGVVQADPPGVRHAYCNAGFSILARLCELVFDMSWDAAMVKFITGPLGMDGYLGGPHALPERAAIASGHILGPDGALQPIPLTRHRFLSPAGGGPMATIGDMTRFADMMLRGGCSASGDRILSADWIGHMKTRWVEGPAPTFASAWGLGMMLHDWSGGQVLYGHDGVVPGQHFFLRIHDPSRSFAAIMTNGGVSDGFAEDVFHQALAPSIGAHPLPLPEPVTLAPGELDHFAGTYSGPSAQIQVESQRHTLKLRCATPKTDVGPAAEMNAELIPIGRDLFLADFPNRRSPLMQRFQDFDDRGVPQVLNFRGRAFHRKSDGEMVS